MIARLTLGGLASLLVACSTLAPIPATQECTSDEDCTEEGERCAPTRVCVPGEEFPPLAHLGFDVQENEGANIVFRTEVSGCDEEVKQGANNTLLLERNELQQTFELDVFLVDMPADPKLPAEILPAGSAVEVRQRSRFAHPPEEYNRRVEYPTFADEMMTMPTTTAVRFPRYDLADELSGTALANGGYFVWRIEPNPSDIVDRAPLVQMITVPQTLPPLDDFGDPFVCTTDLQCQSCDDPERCDDPNRCMPNGECTLVGDPHFNAQVRYHSECDRTVAGDVRLVHPDGTASPFLGASVQLRYADPEDGPRLGVEALTDEVVSCSTDAACLPGQICDVPPFGEARECLLPLAGRSANTARNVDEMGYAVPVYTYCDPVLARQEPLQRSYTASVVPRSDAPSAQPTTNHLLSPLSFPPNLGDADPVEGGSLTLCVPDWGAPVPVELQLSGDPAVLVGSGAEAVECCDVGCLPRTMLEAGAFAEPNPGTCSGSTVGGTLARVVLETPAVLTAAERTAWADLLCVLPEDEDAPIGALTRQLDCAGDESSPCLREDLAAGPMGTARVYSVRVESPVGSVLRSDTFEIPVDGTESTRMHALELGPRALVRGRIRLADDVCDPATATQTDCGSEGAIVLAERLRVGTESAATVPGPYFHEVETFFDPISGRPGAYVLPLDPGGVYLVTALPASGSLGGPADIEIVDLRDESVLDVELDMVLRAGVFVTLDLGTEEPDGFDPRSSVTPLDLGSWRSASFVVPGSGEPIDLDRVAQCLTTPDEGPIACKIRRLIPSTSLTPSQVGQVQFTARAASPEAPAVCPDA